MKFVLQLNPAILCKLAVFFVAIFISVFCTAEMPNLSDILSPLYGEKKLENPPLPGEVEPAKAPAPAPEPEPKQAPAANSESPEMDLVAEAVFQSMNNESEENHNGGLSDGLSGFDRIANDILGVGPASPEKKTDRSASQEAPEYLLVTEGILNWKGNGSRPAEESGLDRAARAAAKVIGNSNRTKNGNGQETDSEPDSEEEDWDEDEYLIEEDGENGAPLAFLPFVPRFSNTREEMIFAQEDKERTMLLILWEEIPALSSFSSLLNEYMTPLMTGYISRDNSGTSMLFHLYNFNQVLLAQSPPMNDYSTFMANSSEAGPPASFPSGGDSGSMINMDLLKRNVLPVALLVFVFILILYISYKQFSL